MQREFRLFPQQGAAGAPEVDALYLALVGVAVFFTALICVLILFFMVRYRSAARVNRRWGISGRMRWAMEIGWCIVPLVIVMATFAWGAKLYFVQHRPPPDALEVYVVGKQWMWRIQHEEGRREINQLHVPAGRPVVLKMISEDVIHSFYVPAFRSKMDVLPGRYTTQWFEPSVPGEYHLFCAEYCGTSHAQMRGRVVVMPEAEYADWVAAGIEEPPDVSGRRLLEKYECVSCHKPEAGNVAPPLEGLFGKPVPLQDGGTVVADEQYIRQSILDPDAHVVAGYAPIMSTFEGKISEEEILQIIAWMKTTGE